MAKSRQSAKLFIVVRIGTPPTPHPQASVSPPLVEGGGTDSLAGVGVTESQFLRGDRHCGTLGRYMGFSELFRDFK
jgi:hypothetical protein